MEAVAAVMADNFKEDGLYVHLLPDPSTRVEVLKLFFRNYIELLYDYGGLYATSEKMEAVALVFRSERVGASWASRMSYTWGVARAIAKSLRMCRYISPAGFLRALSGLRSMSSAWLASLGDQPYLHLDMLVVQPQYRGQGWVRKIMSPLLAECRERRIACTLETQNPRNVGLYEHYGFTIVDTIQMRNSDLKQYCMVCLPGNGGLAERESRASDSHVVTQHDGEGVRMNLTNLRLMNEQVIRIYDTDLPQNEIAKKLIMNDVIISAILSISM
ncbi:GNAT family N-acetyltransferase [Paenibacillus popilliae]|uniref:Histone acetyltransferase n=1 Tax=Paenibacillus popilliae ATCC 14706 TaxID=1212764 RepID=M9LZZ9_PAEPP|nr:GNAT family N-acetyltransferase [Paenibacillus popilliae]GAC41999.1 histone acetyltransferase [Paenibacillus popilliae ATCC 14706]